MKPRETHIREFKRKLDEMDAEQSIAKTSRECEQEEIERLGGVATSPTLEVEQNWNRIRWGEGENEPS